MKKSFLAGVLTICMIFAMFPMTVSAADGDVAMIGITGYTTLQEAITAATVENGNVTITLLPGTITEDVVIHQYKNYHNTITFVGDNENTIYSGHITVKGHAHHTGDEALIFNGVVFKTSEADHVFIEQTAQTGRPNSQEDCYPRNITVTNCKFVAEGDAVNTAVGMKYRYGYDIVVENTYATGLHSLMQNYACVGMTINNVTIEECKGGIAFGTSKNVTVKNSVVKTTGEGDYGFRFDGGNPNNSAVIENCEVEAYAPVLLRKIQADNDNYKYTLEVKGENTMETTGDNDYWCVITGTDLEVGEEITPPAADVTVKLGDPALEEEGISTYDPEDPSPITRYAASVNGTYFESVQAAIDDTETEAGDTVVILGGEHEAFAIPAGKDGLTVKGADGVETIINVLTESSATNNCGINVLSNNVTIENLTIRSYGIQKKTWQDAPIGHMGNGGESVNIDNLTVRNCEITYEGAENGYKEFAICYHDGTLTLDGNTIRGFGRGIFCNDDNGPLNIWTIVDNNISAISRPIDGYWNGYSEEKNGIVTITGNTFEATGREEGMIQLWDYATARDRSDYATFNQINESNNTYRNVAFVITDHDNSAEINAETDVVKAYTTAYNCIPVALETLEDGELFVINPESAGGLSNEYVKTTTIDGTNKPTYRKTFVLSMEGSDYTEDGSVYVEDATIYVYIPVDSNNDGEADYYLLAEEGEEENTYVALTDGKLYTDPEGRGVFSAPYNVSSIIVCADNDRAGRVSDISGEYVNRTELTVSAKPYAGYHFICWLYNGDRVSDDANYTFTVDGDAIVTAVFEKDAPEKVNIPNLFAVEVETTEGGETNVSDSFYMALGSSRTITLTPDEGYEVEAVFVNGKEAEVKDNKVTIRGAKCNYTVKVIFTEAE